MKSWKLVGALLVACLMLTSSALAQRRGRSRNPYDAEQARWASNARRQAQNARAYLDVIRIADEWESSSAGTTTRTLQSLASDRRLPAPLRAFAGALRAGLVIREGELDEAASGFRELGYVTDFRVVGPFDNEGKAGLTRAFGPEAARSAPVDASARYPGKEREVGWRRFPDVARWGYVNLSAVLRPYENVCAYAETFVEADRARAATVWLGANGASRAWLNGEQILADDRYRGNAEYDRAVALVPLRAGQNRLLVKVCNAGGGLGFYLRLGDESGAPATGLTIDPDAARSASTGPGPSGALPAAPVAPLAAMEAAVDADPDDARAHEDLARFLMLTRSDDPDERRALELARRAAELGPTWQRWLLVSQLVTERAEVLRAVGEAEGLAPREPEVIFARALVVVNGPDPDRAFRMLEPLGLRSTSGLDATLFRAGMLDDFGLPHAALAEVERGLSVAPTAVRWLRARRNAVDSLGRVQQAHQLTEELLEARHDDVGSRRRLISDAVARHDEQAALRHIDQAIALQPDSARTLTWAAGRYESLGLAQRSLEAYRAVIDLVPEEASAHAAYGRALLRQNQRDAAAAALREALRLRPQDEGLRVMLEDLRPSERDDERYATAIEEILRRRQQTRPGYPATVLHDLTVNTVFPNGLSSSFRQIVTTVHTDDGASGWEQFSIPFDPATQWVDVRSARVHRRDGTVLQSVRQGTRPIGDPQYRIYYSREAHVVAFPDLSPGDTIELTYRVNDVAYRNVFNDYYGDFRLLGRTIPTARMEYLLITPQEREFYFNEPALPGLQHRRTTEGEQNVDRFVATNLAPLRTEANMPGPSEVVPYLMVSTYRSWEQVGRWWWGLVQDQLQSDAALRRTVAELVDGVTDEREKVARIYGWVIRNTRYVGLEFGIHGFQPYRVPLVVQRGFGDCKDKASLLYVMLREAGIDARLVLVRTRRNGRIEDRPASLSVFDHAIAYVPSLDLYLDGTAENGGSGALPGGDQGVTVLVVGPDGAELRRTPVADASAAGVSLDNTLTLDTQGGGTVESSQEVLGPWAAGFRTRYQAAARRAERIQESLRGLFPGIEVEEVNVERLDDLERSFGLSYRATAPQIAQREGSTLLVAPSRLGVLGASLGLSQQRVHPLDLGARSTYRERRVIVPPAGATVEEMPRGGTASSPFGRLRTTYRRDGANVVVETELAWLTDRVELAQYQAFRRWVGQADALLRELVRFGGVR